MMTVTDTAAILKEIERYRSEVEAATAEEYHSTTQEILKKLAELRQRCLDAMANLRDYDLLEASRHYVYQQYLLHVAKTMAGLLRMAALHQLRKVRLSQHPVKLNRVRRITATHPAIAPPSFA